MWGDSIPESIRARSASSDAPSSLSRSWRSIPASPSRGDVAERFDLRAYDAVHLASALVVDEGSAVLVTWDRALASAASAAGLDVAPTV